MAKFRRSHDSGKGVTLSRVYLKVILLTIVLFAIIMGGLYMFEKKDFKDIELSADMVEPEVAYEFKLLLPYINRGDVQVKPAYSFCYDETSGHVLWTSALIKSPPTEAIDSVFTTEISNEALSRGMREILEVNRSLKIVQYVNPIFISDSFTSDNGIHFSNLGLMTEEFVLNVWKNVQGLLLFMIKKETALLITMGPIFKNTYLGQAEHESLEIEAPNAYYLIVSNTNTESLNTISFVFPLQGKYFQNNLEQYLMDINSLEKLTGIDFFDDISAINKQVHSRQFLETLSEFEKSSL
jgi:DNA/RNA endonuclease G (NUC1)